MSRPSCSSASSNWRGSSARAFRRTGFALCRRTRRRLERAALASVLLLAWSATDQAPGQETAQFFRQNCTSCHTIGGGPLTGPDLKNVTQRRSREWLVRFIQNPKAAIDSGDPTALELLAAAKGVIMPTIPGMTRERADALLQLIENESALEESQFKGVVISDEPFTEQDIDLGRRIFLGRRRLENGGPACIGCHSVSGVGGLGGGRLGPELTFVYQRLGQNAPRKNLSAWLTAPATATMGPVFREHPLTADEVRGLVAFFEEAARSRSESDASGPLVFLFLGVLLAAAMLAGMDAYWRGRHRAVRRPLAAPRRRQAPRPAAAPAGE